MNLRLLVRASAIAAVAALLAQPSAAQERAGQVFIQIFNVDGPFQTDGQGVGSVGCGATGPSSGRAGADDLIAVLNDALNEDVTDSSLPPEQRRDLYRFCDNMTQAVVNGWDSDVLDDGTIQRMQEGLAPDELFMQIDQASALASLQINNVSQRIAQIRLARRGLDDLGGYAFERGELPESALGMADAHVLRAPESNLQAGAFAAALQRGLSSGDGFLGIEGVSAFVNGEYSRLDASSSSHEVGSEGNGGGFTLGIDKQLGKSGFLGLAFGYSYLATDFDHDFGDSELDDISFSTYGSVFFGEHLYLDGIVSGSILLFDQKRKIPSGMLPDFEDLESDPEGWNLTGDFGVGGEYSAKPFDLNPYLRVAVSRTEVDSFDEDGSSLALEVDDQDNTSVTLSPGLSVSLPVSTSFGVVSPYVRGEYVHEFGDQADDIRGSLALVPEAGFELTPNGTDEDYGNVGAGVTSTFGHGISAFVDYDVLVGFSDLVVHRATLGGRLEF